MTLDRRISTMFIAVAMLLLCSACHRKHVALPDFNIDIAAEMPMASAADSLSAPAPWTDVQMPISIALLAPEESGLSGRLTMIRGSEINVSLRAMGSELGVIYINADSVWVIDKYHKEFLAEPYRKILGLYALSVNDLQNLLLGQPIAVESADIKASLEGEEMVAASFYRDGMLRSRCLYSGIERTPIGLCASVENLLLVGTMGRQLMAQARLQLNDARWDEGRAIKFKRPAGYKAIDVEAINLSFNQTVN